MFKLSLIVFLSCCAISQTATAAVCGESGESKPMSIPVKYRDRTIDKQIYTGSYALIVGASAYKYWRPLGAVKDESSDLAQALAAQGFRVRVICDPPADGDGGLDEIERFVDEHQQGKNRLVIYLSGHGWVEQGKSLGYFAAVDSPLPGLSQADAKKRALSSERLIHLSNKVKSGHLMVLIDMCYSAAILTTKSEDSFDLGASLIDFDQIKKPSRWFLTAGSDEQETPSPSAFLPALILGISGYADQLPADGIVRASELSVYVRHMVANNKNLQTTPLSGFVPPMPGEIVSNQGEPVFRYDILRKDAVAQSLKSAGLRFLGPLEAPRGERSDWPDTHYRVSYYRKQADGNSVIDAMKKARIPYLTSKPFLSDSTKTNALACHPDAPISVVKAAARGLIENGVPLRIIDMATKRLNDRRFELQALHIGRVAGDRYRNLTLADLDRLDALKRCPNEFVFNMEES